MTKPPIQPTAAALAVVVRDNRLLVARRENKPDQGRWGFPGGHIEAGETIKAAAVRELREETGVIATAQEVLTAVDVIRHVDDVLTHHYILIAVRCRWLSGEGAPADDVHQIDWFTLDDIIQAGPNASRDLEAIARLALG